MQCNYISRLSFPEKTMRDLLRIDLLGKQFVQMCADLFPFCKTGGLLLLCREEIHSVLHSAAKIMCNLVNSSGEAAKGTSKSM